MGPLIVQNFISLDLEWLGQWLITKSSQPSNHQYLVVHRAKFWIRGFVQSHSGNHVGESDPHRESVPIQTKDQEKRPYTTQHNTSDYYHPLHRHISRLTGVYPYPPS